MNKTNGSQTMGPVVTPSGDEIDSVAKAISIVCEPATFLADIYNEETEQKLDPFYRFPIGLWFRGHSDSEYKLIPSVFRPPLPRAADPKQRKWYDEGMMIQHASLRDPSYQRLYRSTFDFLCLLQHYELPTRLLDWTESILIALYFAVANQDHDGSDGKLYALNARMLNKVTRLHDQETAYICGSNSIDVVVRSEMANARRKKDLRYAFEKDNSLQVIAKINEGDKRTYEKTNISRFHRWLRDDLKSDHPEYGPLQAALRCPVAVFPNRLNPRMTSQLAMVLIYGGKVNPASSTNGPADPSDILPEFQPDDNLESINEREQFLLNGERTKQPRFLKAFSVPRTRKEEIREQLKRIGMHEAALFPEIDHVGNFVRREWICG